MARSCRFTAEWLRRVNGATMASLREVAVFSIFRRTAEIPLYRIEKRPKLRMKQGMYAVIGANGQVLRRGQDLASVLRVLERKMIRAVDT